MLGCNYHIYDLNLLMYIDGLSFITFMSKNYIYNGYSVSKVITFVVDTAHNLLSTVSLCSNTQREITMIIDILV